MFLQRRDFCLYFNSHINVCSVSPFTTVSKSMYLKRFNITNFHASRNILQRGISINEILLMPPIFQTIVYLNVQAGGHPSAILTDKHFEEAI